MNTNLLCNWIKAYRDQQRNASTIGVERASGCVSANRPTPSLVSGDDAKKAGTTTSRTGFFLGSARFLLRGSSCFSLPCFGEALFDASMIENRGDHEGYTEDHQADGNRAAEDDVPIAARDDH